MTRFTVLDYDSVVRDNLKRTLARQSIHKKVLKNTSGNSFTDSLRDTMKDCGKGSVILLESPAEGYLDVNLESVRFLLDSGYEGVYMSFQRPFNNLVSNFGRYDIDTNKILIVDGATVFCGVTSENASRCVGVSDDMGFNDFVNAIYDSLLKLKGKKRFVFVDSLSTMALYKSIPETLRFCNALISNVKDKRFEEVTFLFNIAKDLSNKCYVDDIAAYADHYLHLGLCT